MGGVERRKHAKRHDRLADHLAANPDLLEPGLTFRGAEIPLSSMSGEGGSIDLLFLGLTSGSPIQKEPPENGNACDFARSRSSFEDCMAEQDGFEPSNMDPAPRARLFAGVKAEPVAIVYPASIRSAEPKQDNGQSARCSASGYRRRTPRRSCRLSRRPPAILSLVRAEPRRSPHKLLRCVSEIGIGDQSDR